MELTTLAAQDVALPSIPKVVALLVSEVNRDEPDLRSISQLISTDPALTARILQVSNSAQFHMSGKIGSVSEALALLGIGHLRSLASAAALGSTFRAVPGMNMQQFWRYSLNVAKLARSFAGMVRQNQSTAFTSGLLHAVGEIVMHLGNPQGVAPLDATVGPLDLKRARAEHRAFGYCYAEVGAGFAAKWQFPQTIVDALRHQYVPFENDIYEPLAGVLHLAAWRARAKEAELSEKELAVSFPDVVGLTLGLDIDMVLQQDPIDWFARHDSASYS